MAAGASRAARASTASRTVAGTVAVAGREDLGDIERVAPGASSSVGRVDAAPARASAATASGDSGPRSSRRTPATVGQVAEHTAQQVAGPASSSR